ncbi:MULTISPECIES: type VI secretion system membrane subunit TssM [Erwinia]|uniref:type VI secretion system membrane subunit TssM n=1 Tax=Erwinia TaxID=551 RepID=UPI00105E449C|nr:MULTISPECIES: type VI secretion system membrane subunit TssM [Erwinia]MBP2155478.1 type VI secretion system protein ImpL [Erwinia rhapontici]MCS3605830.1 type VI secretion system protein ImpL [Erwinia rhapontici]NKG32223.1 type VI secretion system membrane subunit TssM [Erwinia rhapontici]NNS06080.1 type VI secretion system membrane subunit TssM [Erwinia sp. JH02]TDS98567.1 type VI secretion system protein ImpL [Erwinia rhapontici]
MLKTFFSLLSSRLLWGLVGVTALSALIWMVGPLLPFTRFQSLDSPLNRQLLIGLCYFLWILFQLIPQLYRAWFNSKLLTRLQLSNIDHAELQATGEMLNNRFSEAAMLLKKTQFGKRKGWLQRFSAQYLYQLPWYLIVGAPGAGKTTALINSGLDFPLSDAMGKSALRGIGGTRHCDWWFTGEAVLLDTAGRYTLQENQRARDASEWQTFITLLKRYRPRQPINGVIMTISVAELLSDSAEARHAQATALRQRMAELHQQTGIPFPVYIMVTKTDLLKGFMRYFARLDKQQREQIWGFTFPWEPGLGDRRLHAQFEQQFQCLLSRLMADLSDKMAQESDLTLRAECFQFPQEFSALRPLLAEYLDIVFSPENSETPWAARGLFFTSGTQEGLPFDRVMGELSRKLQLPQPQGQSIASWDSVNRSAPIPANKGQSYFIHGLLRDVVFKERRLAGSDRSWEQRNRLLHRAGYAVLGVALVAASALWITSYYKNQHYLEQVSTRLPAVTREAVQLTGNNHGNILDLLPFLNRLVALPESSQFSLNAPPLSLRGGLYRGDQISEATWGLYQGALRALLLPRVAQTIAQTLRNDDGKDAEFSRNALRAYQMLYQPRSYDGEFLRGWVMQNLQRSLPSSVTTQQIQQLDWHLSQLLDRQILSSPYMRDNALMVRQLTAAH